MQDPGWFTLELAGQVRGMHRPRVSNIGGHARMRTETVDREAMNDINSLWVQAGSPRLEGAIGITIVAEPARPRDHFTSKGELSKKGQRTPLPCRKPDLDNVAKLVMDALNGRAYRDDVDVVNLGLSRRWSDTGFERTIVHVREVQP